MNNLVLKILMKSNDDLGRQQNSTKSRIIGNGLYLSKIVIYV